MKKPSECPLVFLKLFRGCTANILALMAKEVTVSSGPSAETYHFFWYSTIQPFFPLVFYCPCMFYAAFCFSFGQKLCGDGALSLSSLRSRKDSQNSSDLRKEPPGKSANKHTQVWRDILYVGNQSLLLFVAGLSLFCSEQIDTRHTSRRKEWLWMSLRIWVGMLWFGFY